MKIVCPSCGTENTVSKEAADSADGGLVDVSCQKCGSILPAVSARDVLNELRDELEDEVGELFNEVPQRELQTSTMLIGGSEETPLSSPNLQAPAFAVHDGASSDASADSTVAAQPDDVAATQQTADADDKKNKEDAADAEESWSPAAAGLDSLISEELENAAARKGPKDEDKLLRPPEIKKKEKLEHTPSPAFDADFLTDPALRQAESSQNQGVLVATNPSVISEAPRRNTALIILVTLAAIAILGMLAVIIVLLIKPGASPTLNQVTQVTKANTPQSSAATPAAVTAAANRQNQQAVATNAAASSSTDAGQPGQNIARTAATTNNKDIAKKTTMLAQNTPQAIPAQTAAKTEKKPELSKKLFDDEDSAGSGKSKKPRSIKKPRPKPKQALTHSGKKQAGKSKKPARRAGQRPKGCDPLIYPDPLECPHAAPPGKAEILAVVRAHLGQVDACAKKQFAVDPSLASGTIVMRFWIRPTGRTSKVAVLSKEFKNSVVGSCLKKKIAAWDFGTFDGRKIGPIKFPFRLHTQ